MGTRTTDSLRFPIQGDTHRELGMGLRHSILRSEASRKQLRLDSIPPSGGSGMDASKKLELPPTKKDELKAPSKKTGSTVKKEKPKHSPPKVKGAELWHDCPAEFLSAAQNGTVSGRISVPGPGLLLKEAAQDDSNHEGETSTISKNSLNTRSKPQWTSPKTKGKSK